MSTWPKIEGDLSAIERLNDGYRRITREMGKSIVGQQRVFEEMLIAVFARGHCLLVGVPGLAKTLMIRTLADALNLSFSRIQFTPDLMPSDITGTEVLQEDKTTGQRLFKFLHGPLFANVILADEINRTPPKTQAALLEAMQERAGHRRRSDATSCPIRSSCWPRRIRSNRKAPIRFPRPSRIASCSTSSSIIPTKRKNSRSSP